MLNAINGVEVTTSKANCEYIRKISREHTASMSVLSTPSTPRSIRHYHRGNGPLRGGGLQKVYTHGPSMKSYRNKLDNRLGACIIGCLLTIATVLTIYGLFHETVNDHLVEYITGTKQIIVQSLPPPTTRGTTLMPRSAEALLVEELLEGDGNESIVYKTQPLLEPDTCLGSENPDQVRCLTVAELDEDYEQLQGSHIMLWNLVALNIIIALFLIPLTCIFCNEPMRSNRNYKLFYRIIILLALLFLLVQLVFLISPLLSNAYYFPSLVDKLFLHKLPRDHALVSNVETNFGCKFDYIPQLVELNMQEPCLVKIKNSLFPVYSIVLLIIIDLLPFLFIFFTYAWDAWIKDSPLFSTARRRIELNNQQRPQSREDILKRTMEEPQYV